MINSTKPIVVIGGGITGMTAAVEAAEVGYNVVLIEKEAYLGGRVIRMYRYFPKMCPPTCGYEINTRRIKQNPRISYHTLSEIKEISGSIGNFKVKIIKKPRYVTGKQPLEENVIAKLSSERYNDFNYGLDKTKAVYLPHESAYPSKYVVDREAVSEDDVKTLSENCPEGAIDWDMKEEEIEIEAGAIIIATGWKPYDANKLDNLGYGQFDNVITNVVMERYSSASGPTGGKIIRPSDGKEANNVAFVQCAGSRDENHLPYCSAVCCMASLKQARYVREKNQDSKVTIFYIDLRTIGRLENFYYDMLEDENISYTKGKVAKIEEDPDSKDLILDVEDTIAGENLHNKFDLVVLATGIVPNTRNINLPSDLEFDEYGFLEGITNIEGIFSAGCASRPCDVSHSTKSAAAAALKAIQSLNGGA